MNLSLDIEKFRSQLARFEPVEFAKPRSLAIFSAAVAVADEELTVQTLRLGENYDISPDWYYEIVLQSYLFLGFPRMLTAAECFHTVFPDERREINDGSVTPEEALKWHREGLTLCKRIYAHNYELLKSRVERLAPDIFRWMIIEGYGKVLSRPEPDIRVRELAIIAALMVDNRPKQLFSHIRGALNIGVTPKLLNTVVTDIGEAAGDGYGSAREIIAKLGVCG
jgi:4-carboxymuconolactone decarboxylase